MIRPMMAADVCIRDCMHKADKTSRGFLMRACGSMFKF